MRPPGRCPPFVRAPPAGVTTGPALCLPAGLQGGCAMKAEWVRRLVLPGGDSWMGGRPLLKDPPGGGGGAGVVWGPGGPGRPIPHIRQVCRKRKMKFIKRAGNLRLDFRYTNLFLASDPPPPRPGPGRGGVLLKQSPDGGVGGPPIVGLGGEAGGPKDPCAGGGPSGQTPNGRGK